MRRHTEAGGDGALWPIGGLDSGAASLGRLKCRIGIRMGEDNNELLAAISRDEGGLPRRGRQKLADTLEDLVAGRVAIGIVVLLELVDVEQDHRQRRPIALRLGPCDRQAIMEGAMVLEPREAVGGRQRLQLLILLLL